MVHFFVENFTQVLQGYLHFCSEMSLLLTAHVTV